MVIAAIERECAERHVSQQEYLESHGIAKHQFYRWRRKYRAEEAAALVPAGFVPMMPGAVPEPSQPQTRAGVKQASAKVREPEIYLTVEIRTAVGCAMRIQGSMTASHLREIISAGNV